MPRPSIASGFVAAAAFSLIACVATEREVRVRLDITETDTILLPDTVLDVDQAWLGFRPDCVSPYYGLLVSGRIVTGVCDSLTARATDKEEDGTHYVTLDVRTIASRGEGCGASITFMYDATIEVLGNASPWRVHDWVVSVFHDDVPVQGYE